MMLLLALAGFITLSFFGQGERKKGQLATARFAGGREKAAARRKALKQINARKHNVVAFKIYNSLYLPDAQKA